MKILLKGWLHTSARTGKPQQLDIFEITGEAVPLEAIVSLMSTPVDDLPDWIDRVPGERVVLILINAYYLSGEMDDPAAYWVFDLLEWMPAPNTLMPEVTI